MIYARYHDVYYIWLFFKNLDADGDHCIPMDLDAIDCGAFEESDLTLMEDDDNDGLPDQDFVQQFSFADFCYAAKREAEYQMEIEMMMTEIAYDNAMVAAQGLYRARALAMIEEGKNVHPHMRRLLKIPQDHRDEQGRRLQMYYPDMAGVKRKKHIPATRRDYELIELYLSIRTRLLGCHFS